MEEITKSNQSKFSSTQSIMTKISCQSSLAQSSTVVAFKLFEAVVNLQYLSRNLVSFCYDIMTICYFQYNYLCKYSSLEVIGLIG